MFVVPRSVIANIWSGSLPFYAALQSIAVQIFILLLNVGTSVITARSLGPSGRGIFAAVTIWPLFLALLATAGIQPATIHLMRTHAADRRHVAAASLMVGAASSTIVAGIASFIVPLLMASYDRWILVLTEFLLLVVYANALQMLIKQIFAGTGQFRMFNLCNLLPPLLYLLWLGVVWRFGHLTAAAAITALMGATVLSFAVSLAFALMSIRPLFSNVAPAIREIFQYALSAAPGDIVLALGTYLDKILLVFLVSAGELGIYVVAYSLSRIVLIVQPAISSVILSSMSARDGCEKQRLHDRAFRFALYGLTGMTVALGSIDGIIIATMFGASFASALTSFRILVIEGSISVLASITAQLFLSSGRPNLVSLIQVASLAISILGILVLTPMLGIEGAALGLLLGGCCRLAGFMLALKWTGLSTPRLAAWTDDFGYVLAKVQPRA